jgi:hypothetical protein
MLALLTSLAALAAATTGPGYLLGPPRYRLPLKVLKSYTGRYASTSAAPAARIISSEFVVAVAVSGYPAGGISIYSYDPQGTEQTFVGTLYNFHVVASQVEADIVSTGGSAVLGHVFFRHAGSSRNLVGTIEPPTGGRFAIAYRYAASEGPLPGQAYAPVAGARSAGTAMGTATAPPKRKLKLGWGPKASFLGRYRLGARASVPQAPAQDGIFSLAVSVAERLATAARQPTSGELTLVLRTVKKTEPPVPSGILSVVTPAGSYVLYLTHLESAGQVRTATVNGGSFLGSAIGGLSGSSAAPGTLAVKLSAQGIGVLSVRFTRFSHSPKP